MSRPKVTMTEHLLRRPYEELHAENQRLREALRQAEETFRTLTHTSIGNPFWRDEAAAGLAAARAALGGKP